MNKEIKKFADSGDVKSLKYIFVDALDVDPTFVRYEEEYNYCKSIPGLLEPYIELTHFSENRADWTEEYWTSLKMDLIKNFSDKRMSHMRDVAQVFLADKVQRILAERAANNTIQPSVLPKHEPVSGETNTNIAPAYSVPSGERVISKAELQKQQLEEERRKLEAENKAHQEREAREEREREARREQQRRIQDRPGDRFSKKALGIAAAAVTVAVILILLLK